ncbi:hypothetical protein F-LCD7_0375 [Faustovirus]|nr:hypothetical protein F-LCD7_0375 [Faustovirus]QJX73134.1 hypothetical protein F-VV57_0373 [Faustovirus]QJX73641.1 hypothetical protein F-VV63_0375 [Faustovirus]
MENINAGLKSAQITALSHYVDKWHRYHDYTVLTFFGSSLIMGATSALQWVRHRKLRADFTAAQYHRTVLRTARFGTVIAASWALIESYQRVLPHCQSRLITLKAQTKD